MPVIPRSDSFYLSAGQMDDMGSVKKFGRNAAVGTTQVLIAPQSGDWNDIITPTILNFSSSHDSDGQTWLLSGLDADFKMQSELIGIDGQTETSTTKIWSRVFRLENRGTEDNLGDVYVYEDDTVSSGVPQTPGNIQLKVPVGYNQTVHAAYTVPADYQFALLQRWDLFSAKDAISTAFFKVREFGGVFQTKFIRDFYIGGSIGTPEDIMLKIPAKADVVIEGISTASTTPIGSEFDLILVNRLQE